MNRNVPERAPAADFAGAGVYVFGYGSLMLPSSANRTLQRSSLTQEKMHPAILRDFVRLWGVFRVVEMTDAPGTLHCAAVMDIQDSPGDWCNGVLIRLESENELGRLNEREWRYDRLDVTRQVDPCPPDATVVYVYRGQDEYRRHPHTTIRLASYWNIVEDSLQLWGSAFTHQYLQSTLPCDYPVVEGTARDLAVAGR